MLFTLPINRVDECGIRIYNLYIKGCVIMIIKGLSKLTLLDFPGRTACTVFTGGCNLRCPFCHNSPLVTHIDEYEISETEVFEHLKKRRGILDGVAVTGGEPLIQKDIERFLYEIKCLGYPVKLDTNGCFPERLRDIIDVGLVDYVAVDIKNRPEKYAETVGVANFDVSKIDEIIALLAENKVDYEFRTTVVSRFHTPDDIEAAAEWISSAPRYFLQNFVDSGDLIDPTCTGVSKDIMNEMLARALKHIPTAQLRGL